MAKILLLSILMATIAIPMMMAKKRNARAALKATVTRMAIYIWLWTLFCAYVYAKFA